MENLKKAREFLCIIHSQQNFNYYQMPTKSRKQQISAFFVHNFFILRQLLLHEKASAIYVVIDWYCNCFFCDKICCKCTIRKLFVDFCKILNNFEIICLLLSHNLLILLTETVDYDKHKSNKN